MSTSPAVPCVSAYGWEGPSVSARSVGSMSRVLVLGVVLGSWLPVDFPERQMYSSTACEECANQSGHKPCPVCACRSTRSLAGGIG